MNSVRGETHTDCLWAFDQPDPTYAQSLMLFQNEYETIDHYEGDSVYRPCQKLIATGSTGKVSARLTEGTIDAKDLAFITQEGVILQPEQEGNTLNLELPAACDGDGYKLYALHKEADSYRQVGQLKVVSYSKKTPKVVLVPVGMEKEDIDLVATKKQLNEIFDPVNTEIDLKVNPRFDTTGWDSNQNGVTDVDGDTWFNEYSGEQQELIRLYKEKLTANNQYNEEDKTAYVFVFGGTPQGADGMYRRGDMPIKHQWGFLFGGMDTRTLAHELGHGIFTLRHTFDEDYGLEAKATDNLMDYNDGKDFIKYQWDVMHDPSELGAPFQRDAEGVLFTPKLQQHTILEIIRRISKDNVDKIKYRDYTFYSSSGGIAFNIQLSHEIRLDYLELNIKKGRLIDDSMYSQYDKFSIKSNEIKEIPTSTPANMKGSFSKVFFYRYDPVLPSLSDLIKTDSVALEFIVEKEQAIDLITILKGKTILPLDSCLYRGYSFGNWRPTSSTYGCTRLNNSYNCNGDSVMGDSHHHGVDLFSEENKPVYAVASGVITWDQPINGYGNCIGLSCSLKDKNGTLHDVVVLYAHLNTINVSNGDRVTAGENIGKSGISGANFLASYPDEYHLHLEIIKSWWPSGFDDRMDPELFFKIKDAEQ